MLYYGDHAEERSPPAACAQLAAALGRAGAEARDEGSPGPLRDALVEAGELAQGLADAAFARAGCDDDEPVAEAALAAARAVAEALWAAWEGEPWGGLVERARAAVAGVAARAQPGPVAVRVPEGYAHYAVYPEAYGEAARALRGAAPFVLGLRSIGTSLAAVVAAAAGAGGLATVRPVGHPFRRELSIGPGLARRLGVAVASGRPVAVVDEGPGASGSSFAAAAGWLARAGAAPGQVVFFPSHRGPPGAAAAPGAVACWEAAPRRVVTFEEAILPRLRAAAERLVPGASLVDLSAGAWRTRVAPGPEGAPPVFAQQEHRKYLARAEGGPVLLRFAGLGRLGRAGLERARLLAGEGLAPEPLGLVEGFLAQPWIEGRPLARAGPSPGALVAHLARYLAVRAAAWPASGGEGAPAPALLEAVRTNAAEALGEATAARAEALAAGAEEAAALPRVLVDGKLEPWEWTVDGRGRVLKLDALDHARGHDLAGPQPTAWDVVGAAVELDLPPGAAADLAARAAGRAGPRALAFLEAAYLALRLGRWTFAGLAEHDPVERARTAAAAARYAGALDRRLGRPASWP